MRAWLTMTCGNSDRPSSVSSTRPVRVIRVRSCGSGRQKETSLTQYASATSWPARPNASNISTVRQATPSA